MNINERIQSLIDDFKLSNNEFARRLGVSSSRISHIVTGRNNPNQELLTKILDTFPNVSSSWLLKGEGEMFKPDEEVSFEDKNQKMSLSDYIKKLESDINEYRNRERNLMDLLFQKEAQLSKS